MTAAQWRKLALSQPGAEEKSHFQQPDFRVKNRIFAGLSADGSRGTLRLNHELQSAAMKANPAAFHLAPGAWGRGGWTFVTLVHATLRELEPLMKEAWQRVAPKRLIAAQSAGTAAGKATNEPPPKRRPRRASSTVRGRTR